MYVHMILYFEKNFNNGMWQSLNLICIGYVYSYVKIIINTINNN